MGLRERKAIRLRQHILDTAIEMFVERGYDETTMDSIAEQAEVSLSTLYRYFEAKDLFLIEDMRIGSVAEALDSRPEHEPIGEALWAALSQVIEDSPLDDQRYLLLRSIIDSHPAPRSRLADVFARDRVALEEVIAKRTGRSPQDVRVLLTARVLLAIMDVSSEIRGDREKNFIVVAEAVDLLTAGEVDFPRRSSGMPHALGDG